MRGEKSYVIIMGAPSTYHFAQELQRWHFMYYDVVFLTKKGKK